MTKPYIFSEQAPILAKQWKTFQVTRQHSALQSTAIRLLKGKEKYQEIESLTGVPWFMVALIHEREASGLFSASIAQGDPWKSVSVNEPRGRGPFESFSAAAYDALVTLKHYDQYKGKWSIERILYTLQPYNGLGYFWKGIPSPYVWSCTDQYDPPNGPGGKYVKDGPEGFRTNVIDQQLGCAAILKTMMTLDSSINPKSEFAPPVINHEGATATGLGLLCTIVLAHLDLTLAIAAGVFVAAVTATYLFRHR